MQYSSGKRRKFMNYFAKNSTSVKADRNNFVAFRLNFAICSDNLQTLGSRGKNDLDLSALRRQNDALRQPNLTCDT